MEKNQEYIVDIIDNGYEGEGIAKIEGIPVFVKGALKGEKCKIGITKVLTSHAFARLIQIQKESENRNIPLCPYANKCGGCQLQHMDYETSLEIKQNMVQNLVNKTLKQRVQVEKTVGMGNPFFYRNKAVFPCGIDKNGNSVMGMYAARSHEIIPIENCYLQREKAVEVAKTVFQFIKENGITVYNEKTGDGLVRHIMVRTAFQTGEVMCVIVINGKTIPKHQELIKILQNNYPEIKTLVLNHNSKNTNVIFGEKNTVLFGSGTIEDVLGEYKFTISPQSFYQINPVQTEVLYNLALENASLDKEDIFCDLYCGIGTIGIFASAHVKEVYGVEIIEEAVKDAIENAKRNKVDNATFMTGDVEKLFEEMIHHKNIIPTVVCVDPPRKGVDNKTIEVIKEILPTKIIYISCNPATLVRDLAKLEEKYIVKMIKPVDCFPWTKHVECVAVMCIK